MKKILIYSFGVKRNRTPSSDIGRALYLYFLGLLTRCVAKAIFYLLKVKISHVSIWKWIQKYHPRKISSIKNENWALNSILYFIEYLKTKQQKGEITAGTIKNYYRSIKLFCEMNDLSLRWKKIAIGLPRSRDSSNDRAPTIEEIRRLVDYPDRRIKVIVSVMISSGIRLGAWDYLKWKNVIPILDEKGDTIAAKLIVYYGEPEEYFTFISTESFHLLKEWMDFRRSYGEKITEESWLMRDIWQTTNVKYGANWGLATFPKKLESVAIKRIIDRALRIQGIRSNLKQGQKRHEFKAFHGFRKFFKSRSEQVMKPINVEILMGHSIGISDSYYRPQEKDILEDYLKAIDYLTIYSESKTLEKQFKVLEEENKTNQYIIQGKLQQKNEEINVVKDELNILKEQMKSMLSIIQVINSGDERESVLKSMISQGIYKSTNANFH